MTWHIHGSDKKLFLTFDDGPVPKVTPWVLETLASYQAKATFFCIGNNVMKNPELYCEILQQGHRTGNHTQNHLNGWKVTNANYFQDILKCKDYVSSDLFRPPYGKIKPSQIKKLKNDFKITMWDVLSQDYDQKRTPEQCAETVIREAREGSIVVFHDSIKAERNLRGSLAVILEHFKNDGYEFACLPE